MFGLHEVSEIISKDYKGTRWDGAVFGIYEEASVASTATRSKRTLTSCRSVAAAVLAIIGSCMG